MMHLTRTKLGDVYIVEPKLYGDHRGYFTESYNYQQLLEFGFDVNFVQDNESLSIEAGTIRGLHYQLNTYAQNKIVRVTSGAIYDVVVDIRRTSPTFGHWVGVILTVDNHRQLFIPKGFAHGFCTLVSNTKVLYKVDSHYSPQHDRGILWNDPNLCIDWPFSSPILSEKDKNHPMLVDAEIS